MKKKISYPFERNEYFYGKLLTVRDFEAEQKYFNDKRRMLNKLIHGAGVLSGLQVVKVDEKNITIEPGIALDYGGREIVVSEPKSLEMTLLENVGKDDFVNKNVYLCIAYDEFGKEQVHSITSTKDTDYEDENKNNRIAERYKLIVRDEPPNIDSINFSELIENREIIYSDNEIRITLVVSKYSETGSKLEVRLIIEKLVETEKIRFSFKAYIEGFRAFDGYNYFTIDFCEKINSKEFKYEKTVELETTAEVGAFGRIKLNIEDIDLSIGDKCIALERDIECNVEVGDVPTRNHFLDKYYEQSLYKCLEETNDHLICLAEIGLFKVGSKIHFEKVVPMPFKQYVRNELLMEVIDKTVCKENEKRFSSGIMKIKFGHHDCIGDVMHSDYIEHNLGTGNVFLTMGLIDNDYNDDDAFIEEVYLGDMSLFKHTKRFPDVSLGAMMFPQSGKFRIVFRLNSPTKYKSINVKWCAYKV